MAPGADGPIGRGAAFGKVTASWSVNGFVDTLTIHTQHRVWDHTPKSNHAIYPTV